MTEEQVNRAKVPAPLTSFLRIRTKCYPQTVKQVGVDSGAMTPTEIVFAYRCGAHMVKLFPVGP